MFIGSENLSHGQRHQSPGFLRRMKQKIGNYWRPDTGQNEDSLHAYPHFSSLRGQKVISCDSPRWLRYLPRRNQRTTPPAAPAESTERKELVRRRIIRTNVKPVIRTKSMESMVPADNDEVPSRYMGVRRSLSVPSEEAGRIRSTVAARQNIRGGRTSYHSHEERVVEQTKDFCRDYLVYKLKRNSLLSRVKPNRGPACDQWLMQEIYVICSELEKRNPNQCKNISKQVGITLRSEEVLKKVFFEFALEIVTTDTSPKEASCRRKSVQDTTIATGEKDAEEAKKNDKALEVTWGRIMAVIVIAGALAIDCVKQGHSELVNELIEYCGEFFLSEGIVDWIVLQGGWETLSEFNTARTRESDTTSAWNIVVITACVAASLALGVGISNITAVGV